MAETAPYRRPSAGVGELKRPRPYLIFHQAVDRNAQSALRWGDFQLVKTWKTGKLELFDFSNDLSEANDLSAKMPEKTKELDQALTAFLAQVEGDDRADEDQAGQMSVRSGHLRARIFSALRRANDSLHGADEQLLGADYACPQHTIVDRPLTKEGWFLRRGNRRAHVHGRRWLSDRRADARVLREETIPHFPELGPLVVA